MSAKIVTVSPDLIWPVEAERLWFFPDASSYLRYSPHFHIIYGTGFRMNLPLCYMFVVVFEGKLSVKNYDGLTVKRIDVRDQIWFERGTTIRAPQVYAKMLEGRRYG